MSRAVRAMSSALPHEFRFRIEATDETVFSLRPDDEHAGDRRVGDPGFRAAEKIAALDLARPRDHRAWIGAVIGLGQAEATDRLSREETGQILAHAGKRSGPAAAACPAHIRAQ